MFDLSSIIQGFAIWTVPVVFAITVHEVAHGWVARAFGDPTAAQLGRLTLNPVKHIDPVGTIVVPAVLLMLGGFVFGWAKPVPVVQGNLRNPRKDMAIVALAGPASNLVMALMWAVLLKLALLNGAEGFWWWAQEMGKAGIIINLILMVLNLFPIPPLDGSRVIAGVLPEQGARFLDKIEPYGFFVLVGLLATGVLGVILSPALRWAESLVLTLVGLR